MLSSLPTRNRGRHLDKCPSVYIKTNLFKVDFNQDTKAYIYAVKSQPDIPRDNTKKFRSILINSRKIVERLIGPFVVSGRTVFGTRIQKFMIDNPLTFSISHEGTNYSFSLKCVKEVKLGDISSEDKRKSGSVYSFLNSLLKNFFHQIDYTEIGKSGKYFDAKHYQKLDSAKLIIYKGYSSNFSLLEDGLFLKIDPAVKIVRNESVLEVINRIYGENGNLSKMEKRILVEKELVNKQVMANYGKNYYYVVDSVLFDCSLESYTFSNGK